MIAEFFGFSPSVVDNMKQRLVLASVLDNFCRKRYSLKLIDFYYIGTWQLAAYAGLSVSVCQRNFQCPNGSTTPITAMGFRQCLPLSVVQLKSKHCRNPHCRNGVVDTFGHWCFYCLHDKR